MKEPLSALAISNRGAVTFNRVDRPADTHSRPHPEISTRRPVEGGTVLSVGPESGNSSAMQSVRSVSRGVYYGEPSLLSGQRGVVFVLVVLAHIGLGYILWNYLAHRVTRVEAAPVIITQIDVPKAVDKPEVPPTKTQRPEVYVPVPEYVDVQAPIPENAITVTSLPPEALPSPAPSPPHEVSRVGASVDPRNPLHIGEEYYPDASKRLGEEGACKVELHVMASGSISDARIVKTSGFERLDAACLKGVMGQRMLPATEDGKPVDSITVIRIHWELRATR